MARLPVPGADNGVWGNILNEFLSVELNADGTLKASGTIYGKADKTTTISAGTGLTGGGDLSANRTISANVGTTSGTLAAGDDSRIVGAIQSTVVDAKGDLLVASAADTVTKLTVGSDNQVLTADSTQTTGVKWATPSTGVSSVYPLSAYGFFTATTGVDNAGKAAWFNATFARVFVPANNAIVGAGAYVYTAGTLGTGGLNGFAIYTDSGTLVTSTTTDNNLWTSSGWATKAFSSTIAAQTSDRYVYVAANVEGYTSNVLITWNIPDNIVPPSGGYGITSTARRAFYTGSLSSWPSSIDPTSYGTTYTNYTPFIGLA